MKSQYSITVGLPAERCFAYLAVVANETQWRQSIVGSRYLGTEAAAVGVLGETDVSMGSKSITMAWQIVEFEPGRSVAWRLDGDPWNGGGGYRVEARGEETVITAALEVRVTGIARVLEPLLGMQFGRGLRNDLRRLRVILDEQAVRGGSAGQRQD